MKPRRHGKRLAAEEAAKRTGAILVRPGGSFRWNGGTWVEVREPKRPQPHGLSKWLARFME